MYLGKPVIATGYGGVTDFLDDETGFVVNHRLATLQRSHGPYPAGAVWAEPDTAHAAALMRALADAPEIRGAADRGRPPAGDGALLLRGRRRAHPPRARTDPPGEAGRGMNGAGSLAFQIAGRVLRAEGMTGLRERISDRLRESLRRRSFRAAASAAGLPPIPVLNLLPTAPTPRLGGIQAQLLTRIENEAERRPVALLYPETEGYRLEVAAGGRRLALGLEETPPPSPVALRDAAFERAVARAAAEVGARALHVEGLAGIPLGSLLELHRSGLALVLSVHDFSLFCPRPHLLERPRLRFCDYSRDRERCAKCLAQDWPVGLRFQDERREIAHQLLLAAAAAVYPSGFLRDRHLELFPGLAAGPAAGHRARRPAAPRGGGAPGRPGAARRLHRPGAAAQGGAGVRGGGAQAAAGGLSGPPVQRLRRRRRGAAAPPAPAPPGAGARLLPLGIAGRPPAARPRRPRPAAVDRPGVLQPGALGMPGGGGAGDRLRSRRDRRAGPPPRRRPAGRSGDRGGGDRPPGGRADRWPAASGCRRESPDGTGDAAGDFQRLYRELGLN